MIDVILEEIAPLVDRTAMVVAPGFEEFLDGPLVSEGEEVELCVQARPTGMCDALTTTTHLWESADRLLVVWGDQVSLSRETLERALARHAFREDCAVIPTAEVDDPYVQYDFRDDQLWAVRQSREGDACDPRGLTDVGVFVLSTSGLAQAIDSFAKATPRSEVTGELNLLPLFPFLHEAGWSVESSDVSDPAEAIGINTAEELETAKRRLAGNE